MNIGKRLPGQLKGSLAWKNAECCVAYNLMKLERLVFGWTATRAGWTSMNVRSSTAGSGRKTPMA
jgi:hypothetical protein